MPLLHVEPHLHPEGLFAGLPGQAWALHTRPRVEKCLARHLLLRKVPFFLPLSRKTWRGRDRVHTSYLPLFPGYVFIFGDPGSREDALATHLVVRCLPVEDPERLHRDLGQIQELMAAGASLSPEERLQPGSWVEITAGPLQGLQGKLLRRGKKLKFIVEVHFLQSGASVEIDSWMVEPLSESERAG